MGWFKGLGSEWQHVLDHVKGKVRWGVYHSQALGILGGSENSFA